MAEFHEFRYGVYRPPIYRAAIIPYFYDQNGELQMMFMKPSDPLYGGNMFQIAKGHVDPGEEPQYAAVREGGEELGLKEENIVSIFHLGRYLKYTDVYCCEVANQSNFGEFEDETGEVTWMTVDQFAEYGRDIHRQLVEDAYAEISNRLLMSMLE